jgi:hypothetical protein
MRRIWAAVAATWALLAIVAVLAWSHPPVQPPAGKPGAVLLHGAVAPHTTTHSSPPAAGR